jgi:pyruvate dehydrogenase E1 component alpha subunit
MYRQMVAIRLFEEAIWDLYIRAKMIGLAHLSIGQEATAVGACAALEPRDYIVSTHRGHGHCIARGASLNRMFAEVLGRVTGYCRGKGGTMHIVDMEHRNLGATAIIGGGIGMATGAALSAKIRQADEVTLCFFGDGAANQGMFLEAMNLAAIWSLPLVLLCENNQYGEYTAMKSVTAGHAIADRAAPFGLPTCTVDGMDVLAVHEAVVGAVQRARSGSGAMLIEAITYRFGGHHVGDPARYRTTEELAAWKERDPIDLFRARLIKDGVLDDRGVEALRSSAQQEVQDAVAFALESPWPEVSEVDGHVYA